MNSIAATGAQSNDELVLPALREDIQLLPGPASLGGAPTWAIFDPVRHRYFRISWTAFQLLSHWQAGTATAVIESVRATTTCPATQEDVRQLVQFLYAGNLTNASATGYSEAFTEQFAASQPHWFTWLSRNYLFLRVPLVNPDAALKRVIPYVEPLFSKTLRTCLLMLGLLSLFLISRQWETFTSTFLYFYSVQGLALFALGMFIVKSCHELGHALTATRYGCRVASMGVAFLVFFPVLYTDTTDVYRLQSRKQRLYVSAAGILTEFYLAIICLFAWTLLPDGMIRSTVFVLGSISFTLTVLINMNPLLRFDGYYFLSDMLGMENLQERAFAMGRWKLRNLLLDLGAAPPENYTPTMQSFLILFAWLTWLYRLILLTAIAGIVYYFFFKLLGLMLFVGVMYTFILQPILREILIWRSEHLAIKRSRIALVTGLLLGLTLLAIIPWRSSINVPVVLESESKANIFTPVPGQIETIFVSVGDAVTRGQILAKLTSPAVEEDIRRANIRKTALESKLARIAASTDALEDSTVVEQQWRENQSQLNSLIDAQAQLSLRSPIDGVVVELTDALHPGRWINDSLVIATVANKNSFSVQGYVLESQLSQVAINQTARFVPDQLTTDAFEAHVSDISRSNVSDVDLNYLASVYGGDVAVRQDQNGSLIPESSVYRIRLTPNATIEAPNRVVRGVAVIDGEPKSFIYRAYEIIAAAMVRGSAF